MEQVSIRSKTYAQNRYLNHLVDPSFQGVNRLFVLPFETENDRASHSNYYLPKVEIKVYNVMTDGKFFFDQSINNDYEIYEKIKKLQLVKEKIIQLVVC